MMLSNITRIAKAVEKGPDSDPGVGAFVREGG